MLKEDSCGRIYRVYILLTDGFNSEQISRAVNRLRENHYSVLVVGISGRVVTSVDRLNFVPDINISDVTLTNTVKPVVVMPQSLTASSVLTSDPRVSQLMEKVHNLNGIVICSNDCSEAMVSADTSGKFVFEDQEEIWADPDKLELPDTSVEVRCMDEIVSYFF